MKAEKINYLRAMLLWYGGDKRAVRGAIARHKKKLKHPFSESVFDASVKRLSYRKHPINPYDLSSR